MPEAEWANSGFRRSFYAAPPKAYDVLTQAALHACQGATGRLYAGDATAAVIVVTDQLLAPNDIPLSVVCEMNSFPSFTEGERASRSVKWLPILRTRALPRVLTREVQLIKEEQPNRSLLILFWTPCADAAALLTDDFAAKIGTEIFSDCAPL